MERKNMYKVLDPDEDFTKMKSVHSISSIYAVAALLLILAVGWCSNLINNHLPAALTKEDAKANPELFIAERAWNDLMILTSFGPRVVGSYSNEELAPDFLKREITHIQQLSNKNQKIEIDRQVVSGSYYLDFKPHGMTNAYMNVQNIIVKLFGESDDHALMLNCHYDSVAGSPGANDDGANCVIMIEILRVLSKQGIKPKHSIIFLFNGAEETPLQGAHGFITKHKWTNNIRAFLNLEAGGSGGKEMLFQSGPKHSWLIDHYKKVVKMPCAQVASEEIFQSGAIPSDTDFRIFRDYGEIPGMDFAHVKDGYRYHTKFDHTDYISQGVLQRTGENILNLVKSISNSVELGESEKHHTSYTVFFDFLGLIFISYSADMGAIINIAVILLATIFPYFSLARVTSNTHAKRIVGEMFLGFISIICGLSLSLVLIYLIAGQLDANGHSMVWYSSTYLAPGIYCSIALFAHILIYQLMEYGFGNKKLPFSLGLKVQARLNGVNLFWGLLNLALTLAGLRIGYIMTVILVMTLIANVLTFLCGLQNSVHKWIYFFILGQIGVLFWTFTFYYSILNLFIPITGRSGSQKNPDLVIGVICSIQTLFICSYFIPLTQLLKMKATLYLTLISIFLISVFCAISTNAGFPYRDESNGYPTVQRHFITHASRKFYDINGNIRYTDSGFWFREMDRNSHKTIEGISMPELPIPQLDNKMCESEVFCGLPLYSCRQLYTGGYWLEGPQPSAINPTTVKLSSKRILADNLVEMNLLLDGSTLTSFLIRPKEAVKLHKWSFTPLIPEPNEWKDKDSYFVMITHGLESEPLNVTLTFKTESKDFDGPLVDISVVTTYWEYQREHTPVFNQLLQRTPPWAFAVPSVAALNGYTF